LKLLILVNDLGFLISHRLAVAIAAKNAGYHVHVAYGSLGNASESYIRSLGFELYYSPIQRGGVNPLSDLHAFILLWRLFCKIKPDLVHSVTIKPVLYGGIAARLARVPAVVSAMAGLGFVFVEHKSIRTFILQGVVKRLFRWALGHPRQTLIFQNTDDRDRVLGMTGVSFSRTQIINGSGIELADCPVLPEPEGTPTVVMASRLLRDKGVLEFIAAASLLRKRGVIARFLLVGDPDYANPASVTYHELAEWKAEGIVECLGHRQDVLSIYSQAHIVTLPSYYGEGLPKSLIEAAACGRAIVTTDMPGCRDAIQSNLTGLLVQPRDPVSLADAIQILIRDATLRKSMGKAGRALAERKFGIDQVVATHLKIYRKLLEPCAS